MKQVLLIEFGHLNVVTHLIGRRVVVAFLNVFTYRVLQIQSWRSPLTSHQHTPEVRQKAVLGERGTA